ncbi:MAG: hydrogen peroxide-inducible genes activator [Bacteroidales bacterium]|jgi:LysR family hydrogen peroxide-inducible transcriptional activator|nr:hydrogen peroxide-inducible genes activator [Bacteroidales bacterium]
MTIQQLEYIIAVDTHRHFVKAAEVCFVTQPTLSMMIQKLEEELEVRIFDRSKHPIEPTPLGAQVIQQARISLKHFKQIPEVIDNERKIVKGSFRMGIIPTIASYLVPVILNKQRKKFSEIDLILQETTTQNLVKAITTGTLDGGILAGPLNHPEIKEFPLYYEKFYAYISPQDKLYKEKTIDLNKIDLTNMWLLENEHCLRGQIERLCSRKSQMKGESGAIKYESGNIETLIHVVDYNGGMTILPEMHAMGLNEEQQENLRPFKETTAVREVSLICSIDYVRTTMLQSIMELVKNAVPKSMQDPDLKQFVVDL